MSGNEFLPQGAFGEAVGQVPPIPQDQQAFMDRLNMVNERVVRPLPDLTQHVDHTGIVVDKSGLAQDLNVNMAPDLLAPFAEAGERPGTFTFAPRRYGQFGKERSYRGAFFGVLAMESASGHIEETQVVVKQYPLGGRDDAQHNAIQEITMLEYMRSLGLPTVELAGVIVDRYSQNPLIYVMTKRWQGLESLDELHWEGLHTAEMSDRLHPVIDTLSTLHRNLVFQGDPKFKNIGLDEDGSPIMFDLEHATSVRDLVAGMTPQNEEEVMRQIVRLMKIDFDSVAFSMERVVYPNLPEAERPRTPMEQFAFEATHVFEPYRARISAGGSPHAAILGRAYDRLLAQQHALAERLQQQYDARQR